MFFYTIMNIFITLNENVDKSRTSAGSLSLTNLPVNVVLSSFVRCIQLSDRCGSQDSTRSLGLEWGSQTRRWLRKEEKKDDCLMNEWMTTYKAQ
jgi:hypothetical protein